MEDSTKKKAAVGGGASAVLVAAIGLASNLHGTKTTTDAQDHKPIVINRPHDASGSPLPVTVTQAPNGAPLIIVGHGAPPQCSFGSSNGQVLPDRTCTPGAVRKVSVTAVCTPGTAADARNVTAAQKRAVLAEYGVESFQGEIDHLISLQLGGSNDTKNLWPEAGKVPNGKDTIENRLHAWVCKAPDAPTRTIRLKQAQQAIRTDWTTAERIITP